MTDLPTEGRTLLNEPLVPDPDAARELGPGGASDAVGYSTESVSDEDIAGARFVLTLQRTERIADADFEGLVVAMDAVFHAPAGARFSDADIDLRLTEPADATFEDVAPVTDPNPAEVKVTVTRGGKLALKAYELAEAGVSKERKVEVTRYICQIRSSGAGTGRARWTFEENRQTDEGVGHTNRLVVTLPGSGPFVADVSMRCQIIRPGFAGAFDRVRELILGPKLGNERRRQIRIEPPE